MNYTHPRSETDIDRIIEVDREISGVVNNPHYRLTDFDHILMANMSKGGACVGSMAYPAFGNEFRILSVGVLEGHRGYGIAGKMAELAIEQARKEGMKKICAICTPEFFEKRFNFKPDGGSAGWRKATLIL
jgi:predicted GNAT family acetyltransferase